MALYRQNGAWIALGTVGAVAAVGALFGRTRPSAYEEDVSIQQWGSPAREKRWSPRVYGKYDLDRELHKQKRDRDPEVRIKVTRPGKLGGSGYMSRPWEGVGGRKRILDKCVKEWGFRSCLGSITVFKTWWRNKPNMMRKYGDIIEHDANYLREAYGGRSQRRQSRRSARRKAG